VFDDQRNWNKLWGLSHHFTPIEVLFGFANPYWWHMNGYLALLICFIGVGAFLIAVKGIGKIMEKKDAN
jgi:hypothetical protein